MTRPDDYSDRARKAILAAARDQHDFVGWLAGILRSVASQFQSTSASLSKGPETYPALLTDLWVLPGAWCRGARRVSPGIFGRLAARPSAPLLLNAAMNGRLATWPSDRIA